MRRTRARLLPREGQEQQRSCLYFFAESGYTYERANELKTNKRIEKNQVGGETSMSTPIVEKIVEQLVTLPYDLQERVLQFTEALAASVPSGIPGQELIRFMGTIPEQELDKMREAIAAGCEQVNWVD